MGGVPHITDKAGLGEVSGGLISDGSAIDAGPTAKSPVSNMCLYNAVGALEFQPTYSIPDTPGSHFSGDNVRARASAQGPKAAGQCLHCVNKSELKSKNKTEVYNVTFYVQPRTAPAADVHFSASTVGQGGRNALVMGAARGALLR